MILSVCPKPYIDVNMEVDALCVGMSNAIISKRTYYTGKALNVAIGLARLNANVFATGFMFDENGNVFEQELHREGVPYKFIWNKGRVQENFKFIDRKSMLTEVSDFSPEVDEEKQRELINFVAQISEKCDGAVMSGKLAKGMPAEYYYKVLSALPSHVKKIVDTEGETLKAALKCGVHLVKPNLGELERTVSRKILSKQDMLLSCRELIDMGAEKVLLSLGKLGAVITDGAKTFYCKSINVAMNSTVGAGDGMVAGASNALVKGYSLKEILIRGVAAGTAAVTTPDSISFTRDKYEEVLSSLTVKEI